MKKLIALLLALVMVLSLTACGGGRTETAATEKPAESNNLKLRTPKKPNNFMKIAK